MDGTLSTDEEMRIYISRWMGFFIEWGFRAIDEALIQSLNDRIKYIHLFGCNIYLFQAYVGTNSVACR